MNIENARKIIDDSTTMTAVEALAFTEAIEQLAEAKRLLKLAVEDLNEIISTQHDNAQWHYADEALKLLGGSENG